MADDRPLAINHRLRFRFGLKGLLLLITAASIFLALIAGPIAERRRQQRLLDQFVSRGVEPSRLGSVSLTSLGNVILAVFDSSYGQAPLYHLECSAAQITDDDLRDLKRLHHIRRLNLSGTGITDEGAQYLRDMPYLTGVDLSHTNITDKTISELTAIENLADLRSLGTYVTYAALERIDGMHPLLHSAQQRGIDELKAAGVSVAHVARSFETNDPGSARGQKIIEVSTGMNRNVTISATHIEHINHLETVQELAIREGTTLENGLTNLEPIPGLERMFFRGVNLTDRDLEAIGRQTQLEELIVISCGITDDGLRHLQGLANLRFLEIYDCPGVTREAYAELRLKLPSLNRPR
jgi:hypothetical protein